MRRAKRASWWIAGCTAVAISLSFRAEATPLAAASSRAQPTVRATGELARLREVETGLRAPVDLGRDAVPLSLAEADLDGDGSAELVVGYAERGGGRLAVYRGVRRDLPRGHGRAVLERALLEPAPRSSELPQAPELLLTGDFDDDGNADLVVGRRGDSWWHLLAGDGAGGFHPPEIRELPGRVTAATAGEINRRDGRSDLVVGLETRRGSEILVFEGRRGAWSAEPESIATPGTVAALRLGSLDGHFAVDLAAIADGQLFVVRGRDRRLAATAEEQARVAPARLESAALAFPVAAVAAHDFLPQADFQEELALLGRDGSLRLARLGEDGAAAAVLADLGEVEVRDEEPRLVPARVGPRGAMALLVVDALVPEISVVALELGAPPSPRSERALAGVRRGRLGLGAPPAAVVPLHLRELALPELAVLADDRPTPALVFEALLGGSLVNTTADAADGDVQDGMCDTGSAPNFTGLCTLRAAIQTHNAFGGGITFAGPFLGDDAIKPGSTLPAVTQALQLDGGDMVEIHGGSCFACAWGIKITAGPSTVTGMILRFSSGSLVLEDANGSVVQSNFFGTTPSFDQVGVTSVQVADSSNTRVQDNVFAGALTLSGSSGNAQIVDNLLGVGPFGQNLQAGAISLQGSGMNTVRANFLAFDGVHLFLGANSGGTLIEDNVIGADPTGSIALGGSDGMDIRSPNNNVRNNLVSGNAGNGIIVATPAAANNVLENNRVGTNAAGGAALGNGLVGVVLSGAGNTIVRENLISSNGGQGIFSHTGGANNKFLDNLIGTDANGGADLGNALSGIEASTASTTSSGNVVSGNGGDGIRLTAGNGHVVRDNRVGTDRTGATAIANLVNGIRVSASGAIVEDNVVSGNGGTPGFGDGIVITGAAASGATIRNNRIGSSADGAPLGNLRHGVFFNVSASNNVLGPGNVIAHNGGTGVWVGSGVGNQVTANSIYDNGALGIDLGVMGPTPNDAGDGDGGANNLQNYPVLTSASFAGGIAIDGTLSSRPNRTYRVELFANEDCDSSGFGEAETFLGATQVTTNAAGTVAFSIPFAAIGAYPSATATDVVTGDTSEISSCLNAAPALVVVNSVGDAPDLAPGNGLCDTGGVILRDGTPEPECTLRAAVQTVNARPGTDSVEFDITAAQFPLGGSPVIRPASPIPAIVERVDIDGFSQPVTAGLVGLDGSLARGASGGGSCASPGDVGLQVSASARIAGLAIYGFDTQVLLGGTGSSVVANSRLGTNATAAPGLGGETGVLVCSSPNNEVRNSLLANTATGVRIEGAAATGNRVVANQIGTDFAYSLGLGNSQYGAHVVGAPGNRFERNVVVRAGRGSTSQGTGIRIEGLGAAGNTVRDNVIGSNFASLEGLGCGQHGIQIVDAPQNVVSNNVIASNDDWGVVIQDTALGASATANRLEGNFIGTDAASRSGLGNALGGVWIDNARQNVVGGETAALRNVISGNGSLEDDGFAIGPGILVSDNEAFANVIVGNYVGTTADGRAALGNLADGVEFQQAAANTVGGIFPEQRNVISGNGRNGVLVVGNGLPSGEPVGELPGGISIQGNYVGTNVYGTRDVGNGSEGVEISESSGNLVLANLISGNQGNGVRIEAAPSHRGNVVAVNRIGTDANDTFALPNEGSGLDLEARETDVVDNRIAYNVGKGITVSGGSSTNNWLRRNSIALNGGLGIDLEGGVEDPNSVTANDAGDPDVGPNELLNYPVLASTVVVPSINGLIVTVRGTVDTAGPAALVELFANTLCDPSGHGEGDVRLGAFSVAPNLPFALSAGQTGGGSFLTATTSSTLVETHTGYLNTSEFSLCLPPPPPPPPASYLVINELDAVAAGQELVELSSGGSAGVSLTGKVVVFYDGSTDTSYAAFDLDGRATDGEGYFVLGNAAVPDVDVVFANGLLQDGPDAVALYTGDAAAFPNGTPVVTVNLIDAVVYGAGAADPGLLPLLAPGQPQVDEAAAGNPAAHATQRCPDSSGGARFTDTYAAALPTPGAENHCVTCFLLPLQATHDDLAAEHTVTASVLVDRFAAVAGIDVDFAVTSGPNAGTQGTAATSAGGEAAFTYAGSGAGGEDTITASGTHDGNVFSCTATVDWFTNAIFADGFESGDTSAWSVTQP
jgi:CSLREA domain-containing protein